ALLVRAIERRISDAVVGDRHAEAIAERPQVALVHLLLLVRDVLALAGLAEAVALDGAREDDGRHALRRHRAAIRVVDLLRIVAADAKVLQLAVAQMTHHFEQPQIRAPEILTEVGAVLDHVALVLAVDDFAHALDEQAVAVVLEQPVPLRAPQHLDNVPSGAAEHRFELLDDLAVSADRTVEPLQVAVDDEDQVVELLAGRERDRTQRFRLVRLTVAEEGPDLLIGRRLETSVLE